MMAVSTLIIAILLLLTGAGGFFLGHPDPTTGHVGYTALIPAWIGLALGILGGISLNDKARKHAMHVAAMIGLVAALVDGVQLILTIGNTKTPPEIKGLKIISMSITLLLCGIFVALCIRSFIQAKRNRLAGLGQ